MTLTTNWRDEVLEPSTMTDADLRDELRHDLDVYDRARHPLSRQAMGSRINDLVSELDLRSHEPPRNSGEGTAVNGPMPLGEKDESRTAERE